MIYNEDFFDMKTIFIFSVINLLVFFRLLTLFSCWEEDHPYYTLSEEELEYLDYNGYWVFEDMYGTIDTVNVESVLSLKEGPYGPPRTGEYIDIIRLYVGECKLINSDSSDLIFRMGSGHNVNGQMRYSFLDCEKIDKYNFDGGSNTIFFLYGTLLGKHLFFGDTNYYKEHKYTIEKGVGLTMYKYDDGDSTYWSTLIGYQYD